MSRHKCPKPESLFEYVSIYPDLTFWERFPIERHTKKCSACSDKMDSIRTKLDDYFSPDPDITSSLLHVYSRLKEDETLILKGWKLDSITSRRESIRRTAVSQGWFFRGAIAMAVLVIVSMIGFHQASMEEEIRIAKEYNNPIPLAQIRVQEDNKVSVHYVRPELLHSVEFQTTSVR